MAVVKLVYLFDVAQFREVINPVVHQLVEGDLSLLQSIATTTAERTPQIWSMLEAHRLHESDLGREQLEFSDEAARCNFWLMILVSAFWKPIEVAPMGVTRLTSYLSNMGWSRQEIQRLAIGNSQRALLQPELVLDPVARPTNPDDWPFWCWFGRIPALTGWLDFHDIQRNLIELDVLSQELRKTNDTQLFNEYKSNVAMLLEADEAQQGLFVAFAD